MAGRMFRRLLPFCHRIIMILTLSDLVEHARRGISGGLEGPTEGEKTGWTTRLPCRQEKLFLNLLLYDAILLDEHSKNSIPEASKTD